MAKDWFVLQDEARRVTNLRKIFIDTQQYLTVLHKLPCTVHAQYVYSNLSPVIFTGMEQSER